MTRIAVIGLGRWGKRLVRKLKPDQIVSVVVTDPAKHDSPIPLVSSFDAMAATRPSHVFVLSPISCLRDHTMQALSLGASVFVEKPFTYDATTLDDIAACLSENRAQKLHVNHLFQYSALLNHLKGAVPSRCTLRWHKFSASKFSIEENLLSHAVTIFMVLFGPSARIELRQKKAGTDNLSLNLTVGGTDARIDISVTQNSDTRTAMLLTFEGPAGTKQIDLLQDPADKLQRSIDDFLDGPQAERMENFRLHCAIAEVMRNLVGPAR